jgi:DNA polymerase-3 subunit delta
MKFEDIIVDLRNKKYSPVYFLMGEEPYYIDKISDYITVNVLDESEKPFNQIIFYGKDTDIGTIIDTARRFPMMASHFVVIVREAQQIRDIEDLIHYVEKPQPSTLLVICYKYKTLDKRKKLYKSIDEKGVLFESKKLYEDKITDWITSYLKSQKRSIEPKAAFILTENLGSDLGRISGELDKLLITLPGEQHITADHIEKYTGISKEYNNFELHKALGQKNVIKANRIINYFSQDQKNNPLTVTITSLYYYFSRVMLYHTLQDRSPGKAASALQVNPFFLKDYETAAKNYSRTKLAEIISLLREYDLSSKGYGSAYLPEGELLRELVFKILH